MTGYSEKLKDPRWQRKRLEILQRDDFRCRSCERNDKTLHVHHSYYENGKSPWEYPDDALLTLCVDCHSNVTEKQIELARALASLEPGQIDQVIGYVRGIQAAWWSTTDEDIRYTEIAAANAEQVEGAMDAFHIPWAWESRYLDTKRGIMNAERMDRDRTASRDAIYRALGELWGPPWT